VTATVAGPRRRRASAAAAAARGSSSGTGRPSRSPASDALTFSPTRSPECGATAPTASARAEPLVSTHTGRSAAARSRTSAATPPAGTPGGRLPHRQIAAARAASTRTSAERRCQSAAVTGGPGSLITVASPRPSTIMTQVRLSPPIRVQRAASPSCSASAAATRPVGPPRNPQQSASRPSRRATRATFSPLPPHTASTACARQTRPAAKPGTTRVRSIETFGLTHSRRASVIGGLLTDGRSAGRVAHARPR